MLNSTLFEMQLVNVDGHYVHKDDTPHPVVNEDVEMVVVDTEPFLVKGSSSGAHNEAHSSLGYLFLNINQMMENFFTISENRHHEIVNLNSDVDSRVTSLEHKFDVEFGYDSLSDEF
ncbi:unnamed protein product [Sphenostylis stenocarpa]|uniref:Uncharacterized protein n=1 Tax=Sphenostylis stenocarpa TaxID=92480 RepID=A0AA86SMI8_9FABA|nr:unnamed protein product [Sphenostylis stenocarpa]